MSFKGMQIREGVNEQISWGMRKAFWIKQESQNVTIICVLSGGSVDYKCFTCFSCHTYALYKAGRNTSEPPNPNPPGMLWIL